MRREQAKQSPFLVGYVTWALLMALPGVVFTAKAVSMHLDRQRNWDAGFVIWGVPGIPGMPIEASIRWMLVFSVPSL